MNFEEALKKVADEHTRFMQALSADDANVERVQTEFQESVDGIIETDDFFFGDDGTLDYVMVRFPEGKFRYYDYGVRNRKPDDVKGYSLPDYEGKQRAGDIELYLPRDENGTLSLLFFPGLIPQEMPDGNIWTVMPEFGSNSDFRKNETRFGWMQVSLGEYKGKFCKKTDGKTDLDVRIHLTLSSGFVDYRIVAIKVAAQSLGQGELTSFFRHVDYELLDGLVQDS